MKGWLIRNKHTIILYAVIILLIAALCVTYNKLSIENTKNEELTSKNIELTSENAELTKGNSDKDKELEEKDEQIKKKNKQIKDLKKKNKELLAAKKKAAAAALAKKAAAAVVANPSVSVPSDAATATAEVTNTTEPEVKNTNSINPAAPAVPENKEENSTTTESADKTPSDTEIPDASSDVPISQENELNNLIASMLIPRPVEKPIKNHVCYLTFDDGPSTNITPRILEILKNHDVKATFFVVGTGNLSLLPRMVNEGHAIGLHSFTHDCYSQTENNIYSTTQKYLLDLKSVSDAVASVTGLRPSIIRFPGGGSNLVSRKVCPGIMTNLTTLLQDMGYSYFDWNVSSGDADGKAHTPEELISFVVNNTHVQNNEGICVLMHDTNAKTTTADALDGMITELKNRGYSFETLSPGDFGFHQAVAN